jgi:predicted CxxxxCH...CXXCH cytochrome family protein
VSSARLVRLAWTFAAIVVFGASSSRIVAHAVAQLPGDTPDVEDPLHAQYAAQGYACVDCHPCGGETNGHDAAWGDPAAQTFHASAANRGLDPCRSCHGGELDGSGRTSLGCASCHGETWRTGCTMCHGDPDAPGGAPPRATWGNGLDPMRVGAHRAHLESVHGLAAPVRCGECHVVPDDVFAPEHVDGGTAEVTFGPLASRPTSATAAWDRTTASCTTVYCHGATLDAGGLATAPLWTSTDGTYAACGACHAAPPPEPHPVNPVCGDCHAGFTETSVDRAVHVDGKVDLDLACASCHGGAENAAPPAGTRGEDVTSLLAVGAHQAHVRGGALAGPIDCIACHVVPGEMLHSDQDAAVTFGAVAVARGAIPEWNRAGETCSSTYCHGAFAGGAALNAPSWTIVNGTQALCGSCHGKPPPAPHFANPDCARCHLGYTATTVALATHVDGVVNVRPMRCDSCHGADGNAAPPASTRGETETTARAVGAHRRHLEGGALGAPIACGTCHLVPATMDHFDGAVQVLPAAGWDAATATCATSCHGAARPLWTQVDGTQAACGTCHGAPPPVPHVQNGACERCHEGYTAASVNLATHVDGRVDVKPLTCTFCHGSGTNPAPPLGTSGETTTTARAVGAHQAHLAGGTLGAPVACEVCHELPATMVHADGVAGVKLAGWDPASATCSSTSCHRAFAPSWTTVDGSQVVCGSCHGVPASPHTRNPACESCHPGYTGTSVNAATHVDGTVDVKPMTCAACHGRDGVAAPPFGTKGETDTTARAVGAHRAHLDGGTLAPPVACGACHAVPTAMDHLDGAVQVAPAAGWSSGTLTCTNACHGAGRAGGVNQAPLWTRVDGTQDACGSCHGAPPPPPHVQNPACGSCHEGYAGLGVVPAGWTGSPLGVNLATHIDGDVDLKPLTCTSCHGTAVNAAPPVATRGETATTARAVGAHQAHVQGGALGAPVACATCHAVPTAMLHADGAAQVLLPGWDPITGSCASTYCHGSFPGGNVANAPSWTVVDGSQVACGSCHGVPAAPHTSSPACGNCHPGYTASSVNAATHVDGDVDVKPMTCTACHGEEGRAFAPAAPPLATAGQTEPSQRGVGAHQRHLAGGAIGKPVACEECHAVPTAMDHSDGAVGLAFGALSRRVGAQPSFDAATGTCSGVYCHGAVLRGGGTNLAPLWTAGPEAAACGACHGNPPPPPHVQTKICNNCHPGYTVDSVNVEMHMNGVIDADDLSCTKCHGDESRVLVQQADVLAVAAPPYGSRGETEPTSRSVGQHQAHVNRGNGLAIPNKCRYCHAVPAVGDNAHANGKNDVAFTSLSVVGGAAPVWDAASGTCSNTYCHGSTLNRGGTSHTPSWVGTNPIVCGSCHGTPPPLPHPQDADCIRCHPGYTQTSVRKATHVNGISDFPTGCNSCHDNPPNSGEHYEHIQEGVACSKCHAGYTRTVENPVLHRNAKQDVTLSGWNASRRTCSNLSCHESEYWGRTSAGTAQSCNRCHGVPPRSGEHSEHSEYACSRCHGTGFSRTTVNPATHMNGQVTITLSGYDPARLTCSSIGCHGGEDWGRRGSVQPNCAGCHGFPPSLPHPQKTACQDCHPSMNANGTLSEAHNDGNLDISGAGCSSCHGFPPTQTRSGALHTTDANCYGCHSTSVDASNQVVPNGTHNDGALQVGGGGVGTYGCQSCHGDQARTGIAGSDAHVKSAPPLATRGGTDPSESAIGAHQAHVNRAAGALAAPVACSECHVVPETMNHATGVTDVTFGERSRLGGATPAWDGQGCTSTYCHGATLGAGGTNHAPTWTGNASQVACGSCHGAPPPPPHSTSAFCQGCHPGYTATSVNLAKHVNGTVDAGTSCGDCHGLPPPAPHSASTECGSCHLGYTQSTVDAATHGNGTVDVSSPHPAGFAAAAAHGSQVNRDGLAECKTCHGTSLTGGPSGGTCDRCHSGWATSCTFCHGNATTGRASPPVDTQGRTARTYVSVGAHDKHVGTTKMLAVACVACHPARGDAVSDPAHVDPGPSEVFFAGQARGLGAWTRTSDTAGSCASTYCHGNFTNGRKATVSWTSTTVMTCNSCHRSQSGSSSYNFTGEHDKHVNGEHIACSQCHGTGYSSTAVNAALHVNGTRDLVSTVRWNATSRSCSSNSCHGSESWY